ncbi:MAG: hypothetical protein ACFB51_09655 [Anaerolineae bacterium]
MLSGDDAALDSFGAAVAIEDDVLVVGAPGDDANGADAGAFYVFEWDGATWMPGIKTTGPGAGALIGSSIDFDGGYIAVGAPGDNGAQGSVYVYQYTGGAVNLQDTASGENAVDSFGASLDLDGNRLIVGAPAHDIGSEINNGAAYIFERSGSTWNQIHKLTNQADPGSQTGDAFGSAVGISGAISVVGAQDFDDGALTEAGRAYIFQNGSIRAALRASDVRATDKFGNAVAIDGSTVVVAAFSARVGGENNAGYVYVFNEPGGGWSGLLTEDQQFASPTTPDDGNFFGSDVALEDSLLVIGEYRAEGGGIAHVYEDMGGGFAFDESVIGSDTAANDDFGVSVGVTLAEERVAVGANREDPGGVSNAGAVYVFDDDIVDPSELLLFPDPLVFQDVIFGQGSPAETMTVENIGASDVTISNIALNSGALFTIVGGTCGNTFPFVLGVGASCTLDIVLDATSLGGGDFGRKTDTVVVTSDALGSPDTAVVQGYVLGANLFDNPSFEAPLNPAADWVQTGQLVFDPISGEFVYLSERFCGLTGTAPDGDCVFRFADTDEIETVGQVVNTPGGTPSDEYRVGVYVAGQNVSPTAASEIEILLFDGGGQVGSFVCPIGLTGTFNFQFISCLFTTGVTYDQIVGIIRYDSTAGIMGIDAAELRRRQ